VSELALYQDGHVAPLAAFEIDPPSALVPDSFAQRLYVSMAPVARVDPVNAWSLLILCNAIGTMYQLIEDYVRDSPDGPGWSALMDLDRCPTEALPWLAQFAGVRLLPGTTDAQQRERIRSTDGFRRGTVAAITAAAQRTLTGAKTVGITERAGGDAYAFTVTTYAAETPDTLATYNALLAQKPGGLKMTYSTGVAGQVYSVLAGRVATYSAMTTRYPNYTAVEIDPPP
jgi:Phage tail protein (Tail_P2_I)